jgi:hypothetical protein
MKRKEEFFITVANYPLSGNIDKYLATLNAVKPTHPKTAPEQWYPIFIIGEIETFLERNKSVSKVDKHGVSLFGDQNVVIFEKQRNILLKALEHVISNRGLEKSSDLNRCIVIANKRLLSPKFALKSQGGGETKVEISTIGMFETANEPELALLENIFSFACYSLISFLAVNNRHKIKKCLHCLQFFAATKLNPRQKFCSLCSPKNKMTREERSMYMKKYRADQEKKRRS